MSDEDDLSRFVLISQVTSASSPGMRREPFEGHKRHNEGVAHTMARNSSGDRRA